MAVLLRWSPRNSVDSRRIYRSETPFTPDTAPAAYDVISGSATEYLDTETVSGATYYYAVGDVSGVRVAVSSVVSIDVVSGSGQPYPSASFTMQGAWTWFNDPRVISVSDVPIVGAVNSSGDIVAYEVDGSVTVPSVTLAAAFEIDDHDNPAFLKRVSDNHIMVWYSEHNGTVLNQHVSTSSNDAGSFGAATNIYSSLGITSVSYANPVQLEGETNDPIYLFMRGLTGGGDRVWHYSKSTDDGATWATATQLLDSVYGYVKVIKTNSTRMDFFVSDTHPQDDVPGVVNPGDNSVYHFYYEGGTFYKIDGTSVTLPIDPDVDLTPIWDGSTINGRSWVWDIAMDGTTPVVVYATYPTLRGSTYRYAKWNGSSWDDYEVAKTGGRLKDDNQPYYVSGISIDQDDTDVVYFGQRQSNDDFLIIRGETYNGGASWSLSKVAEGSASGYQLYRPFAVPGQVTEPRLVYNENAEHSPATQVDGDLIIVDSRAGTNAAPTGVSLSKTFAWDDGTAGTGVAYIEATGDDFIDACTFSIVSDPDSKFQISGNELQLSAAVTAGGSHAVTIRATTSDGSGSVDQAFTIDVIDGSVKVATTTLHIQEQDGELLDIKIPGMGTPKYAQFTFSSAYQDNTLRDSLIGSFGMTDGTTQGCVGWRYDHNDTTVQEASRRHETTKVLMTTKNNGALGDESASFDSWVTDGVRLAFDRVAETAYLLTVELRGGADLSVDVGVMNLAADTSTVTVTPGFQINDLVTASAFITSPPAGATAATIASFGMASFDGTTIRQGSFVFRVDVAQPTLTQGEVDDGSVICLPNSRYAVLQNITATSFDVLTSGALAGFDVLYAAFNFNSSAESWVGVLDTPTSTGSHDFTGPSFTPVFFEQYASMISALTTSQTSGEGTGCAIIAGDASHLSSLTWASEDNVNTTNTQCGMFEDLMKLYDHQGAEAFSGAFTDFITGGVRVNFTNVDGTARKWPTRFIG